MSATGSILSNDGALMALNSIRLSSNTTNSLEAQLSSGKKINSPADNPAGYITAEGFTAQINGIGQATSNANQGVALLQTAEGAINQQNDILQQMNSIAVQAANGTQTPSESQSLQAVVSQLTSQVNTIAEQTQFNNINLLDGSFNGVSFQVGANNGQTISLSMSGTKADSIGMNASAIATSGTPLYSTGNPSGVFSTSGAKFTAGTVSINGSNGSAKVAVTATESAASIAQAVNQVTSSTNVAAQATTSMAFTVGSSGSNFSFTLGNGSAGAPTNTVNIEAVGKSALVDAINSHTATTGVTAQVNASGDVVMTQSQGDNITITNMTAGTLKQATGTGSIVGSTGTPTKAEIQGVVQFQSDAGFNLGSATNIGLKATSTLHKLSDINVSTLSGAEKAINVIKYALQGLGAEGGQLGATQQRLQADINNLNTTSQNLTSARSVVQDANIPQVSQQLTEQQVLQQAGVSALRASTSLQQLYQRLLP